MKRNKKMILAAVLLALLIVLSRFLSVKTPIMKISFGFVPVMLCATWLGWRWSLLINVLGDVIGALLFPSGPFFIGYTISAAVAGLIYGICLYNAKGWESSGKYAVRVLLAVALVTVIVNMGMNTLWTSMIAGQAFWPLLGARVVKELVMVPVRLVTMVAIEKALRNPFNKYVRDAEGQ